LFWVVLVKRQFKNTTVFKTGVATPRGISAHFISNDPYFKTFYFILKWVKARKLSHSVFIMLCFKMIVATPGYGYDFLATHGLINEAALRAAGKTCLRGRDLFFYLFGVHSNAFLSLSLNGWESLHVGFLFKTCLRPSPA
jgi:hypothetical protein